MPIANTFNPKIFLKYVCEIFFPIELPKRLPRIPTVEMIIMTSQSTFNCRASNTTNCSRKPVNALIVIMIRLVPIAKGMVK